MKYRIISILLIFVAFTGCRKSDYLVEGSQQVLSDDGSGTGTVTWTKDKDYILEGFVFVNDGQTLTIEAGTIIRFKPGQGENASALIISRGGKIIANGTADEPIIFTSEDDDSEGAVEKSETGLWGGLIILGNAPVNIEGGEASIEGIPFAEPRGIYGGVDETDNSGVLKYVSIRHGGTNIGDGNEINGLTLGGVGSETEIDYVEVISNEDDGVEIFGGTVNLKHVVVSGCGDDAFDYDLGWSGNGQFWLAQQSNYMGDNLIEAGGGVSPVNGLPFSLPTIFNVTLIGNGNTSDGACVNFRNYAGGTIANSVFLNKNQGVLLEVTDSQHDCFYQWQQGNLDVKNNLFYDVASSTSSSVFKLTGIYSSEQQTEWENYFNIAKNGISNPQIDWSNGIYIPEEKIQGDILETPVSWFQIVNFKGAFGESNWIEGWTLLTTE
ncbi:hypothetical protein [Maribellus maritimus]|uniref:hypothetical protein n=1 Tax=Maribellus maritimus TaxID=2870838 RepID=UPI001EEB633F|nr:hypothetical protein [Maribellus maritimus]MCG6189658.1 hypothetical protein [Maribellus maritimus]